MMVYMYPRVMPNNHNHACKKQRQQSTNGEAAEPRPGLRLIVRVLGRLLPRCIRLNKEREAQENVAISPFGAPKPDAQRRNLSTDSFDVGENMTCRLLNMLPPELRLEIYSFVLGRDTFRLITVPWKITTASDADGNVSMTRNHFKPESGLLKLPYGISLLMTCHQIYREAIDLLYSTNTFVLYDFSTMYTFSRMVPRQRIDTIRYLKIHYGPNTSIPYPHARTEQYDLPFNLDNFWKIVIDMKSLRSLDVYFEAYDGHWPLGHRPNDASQASYEIKRLGPLLGLRGLSTFRLQLGYISSDDFVIRYESYAPAFREMLMETAIKPRERNS